MLRTAKKFGPQLYVAAASALGVYSIFSCAKNNQKLPAVRAFPVDAGNSWVYLPVEADSQQAQAPKQKK